MDKYQKLNCYTRELFELSSGLDAFSKTESFYAGRMWEWESFGFEYMKEVLEYKSEISEK